MKAWLQGCATMKKIRLINPVLNPLVAQKGNERKKFRLRENGKYIFHKVRKTLCYMRAQLQQKVKTKYIVFHTFSSKTEDG